jgi:hypothetical protein
MSTTLSFGQCCDLSMAASSQSGSLNGNFSNSTIIVSLSLILGTVIVVGFLIRLLRRTRAIVTARPLFDLPHPHQERQKTVIKEHILESFPIVRYSARLLNKDGRLAEIHRHSHNTNPKQIEVQTAPDEVQLRYASLEAKDIRESEITTKVGNYTSSYPITTTSSKEATAQNKDCLRSIHENVSCSVCNEAFSENEKVRILSCGDFFHRRCIDLWLLRFANTCPLW